MAPDRSGDDVLYDGLGHTTVWDGSTWTAYVGAHPAVRAGAAMAYDARTGQVILYGGVAAKTGGIFADTWSWDGHGWRRVAGAAEAQAVPSAWKQPDPDVSLNRFSRAQVMASARRAFPAGPGRHVEVKLLRVRDTVRMGIGPPGNPPWWDPPSTAGAVAQGGASSGSSWASANDRRVRRTPAGIPPRADRCQNPCAGPP